ncbi:MAG TPA: hypothetical protein VGO58_04675 [Chitinophagaceae bacterium]|nr:hypothetical protein [Chitinophagaceae bacterium]
MLPGMTLATQVYFPVNLILFGGTAPDADPCVPCIAILDNDDINDPGVPPPSGDQGGQGGGNSGGGHGGGW